MKSFENLDHIYTKDLSNEYSNRLPSHTNHCELILSSKKNDRRAFISDSEDSQNKSGASYRSKREYYDSPYKSKEDQLKERENEIIKNEIEINKMYEQLEIEKEKWYKTVELQLEEIENKELDLEAQREELATELEKCQILGESLHKIQADIRAKSTAVKEQEKKIKSIEERLCMKIEDIRSADIKLKEFEDNLNQKESEIFIVLQEIQRKYLDIKLTTDMFETINEDLLQKTKQLEKDSNYLKKNKIELDKQKIIQQYKSEKLENWENLLEARAKKLQMIEENLIKKIKNRENRESKIEFPPSVTTEEDDDVCISGYNVITSRSNESNF